MCDNCNRQGLAALEAIANGEDPPKISDVTDVRLEPYSLPFPLMVQITDSGYAMIMTTEEGWETIKGFLASIGRRIGH